MKFAPQLKIPAFFMRSGTSKGVFLSLKDLPAKAQVQGENRDALLLRIIGSPDAYGKQIDGMGGATSSTSKAAIISKSDRSDHDIDYLFGQLSIDKAFVDWSGNCGNLSAGVGAFAIEKGLIPEYRIPQNGVVTVRIWQVNIGKTIICNVPICNGQVQETGDFELDGVTFPAAKISVEFLEPVGDEPLFPTGNLIDQLIIPEIGKMDATMISAGIPTIFVNAKDIGFIGTESQEDINNSEAELVMFEKIRRFGAFKMGLIKKLDDSELKQHTPKVAIVGPAKNFISSSGKHIDATHIDINVRALSMGKLHHAMMGTAAVAIGTAAAIPNTLISSMIGKEKTEVSFGHPSGSMQVGAKAIYKNNKWLVDRVVMSRSARVLMEGWVRVPTDYMKDI